MTITYIDDRKFGELVDHLIEIAKAHFPDHTQTDPEAFDVEITEALLTADIWPASWVELLPGDAAKSDLIRTIAEGHKGNRRG